MFRSVIRVCGFAGVVLLTLTSNGAAKIYRVTDLGSLLGGYTIPQAINNKGQIVGSNYTPASDTGHAFLWENGVMTDLGTLGGEWSAAWDINDNGVIVGDYGGSTGNFGFVGTAGGGSLSTLDQLSDARGINNAGVIVGTIISGGNPAILDGGGLTVLPVSGGANAVNDSGWVVGQMAVSVATPPYSVGHGFLYRDGALTDLGNLQGLYDAGAHDINDSGLIVGNGYVLIGIYKFQHACEWRDGSIIDIHPVSGSQNSYCYKLNNRGDIVGQGYNNLNGYYYFPFYHFADGGSSLSIVSDTAWQIVNLLDINDSGQIAADGFLNGVEHGFRLDPVHITFQVVDGLGNPVKNDSVSVYREFNDAPFFNNLPVGKFKTDSTGLLRIPDDSLDIGYHFRVSLDVKNLPAPKHTAELNTKYRYTLDNAVLDTVGAMSYDTVSGDSAQLVILGHTTMAYSLLVSVEWDADASYLYTLKQGFQRFSDYMYDVSDGQMRLDTVQIYTNGEHFNDADFRIYASNMQWPRANPSGIDSTNRYLYFPRVFFGSNDADRNDGFNLYPFNLNQPNDYRTKCHEFGHYALGFYDEYLFTDSTGTLQNKVGRCTDPRDADYGCMDYQYPDNPSPYTSEWSSSFAYATFTCRNNAEWIMRGMSCWDYLQSWAQYTDSQKNVFVPILRPDDRIRVAGLDYLAGPNDDLLNGNLDYNVGLLVQYPIDNPPAAATTVTIYLTDTTSGVALAKSQVKLQHLNGVMLDEGQTADVGGIRLLGYLPTDTVYTSGRIKVASKSLAATYPEVWVSGAFNPGPATTVFWSLPEVSGIFPLICAAQSDSTSATFSLTSTGSFSAVPSLEWDPGSGSPQTVLFSSDPGGYTASVSGDLGASGNFTIHAVDSASNAFFFSTPYTVSYLDLALADRRVFGPAGQCEIRFDTVNTQVNRVLIVSSDYLPIRTGLDPAAVQGGNAYSVTTNASPTLAGTNQITIRYSESNLYSASFDPIESYLQLYRWNSSSDQWDLIGGTVDTADNEITGPMTATGVYAAFTNNSPTGINDHHNGTLPDQFELGQNYPNPFNPTTTITYALPTRAHVTLAIYNLLGQLVKSVVDETEPAGQYSAVWDGKDGNGRLVASGVYFYKLTADTYSASRKMLLLK